MTQETWDPGRMLKTLLYYDALPLSEWLKSLWGKTRDPARIDAPVILAGGNLPAPWTHASPHVRVMTTGVIPPLDRVSVVIWGVGSPADQDFSGLVAALRHHWQTYPARMICDFRDPSSLDLWGALDDVVMGGVSVSQLQPRIQGGVQTGLFTGTVSTANSGGFASVRTRTLTPPLNLADQKGLSLRLRGDGLRYKFFLRSEPGWDAVAYSSSFETQAGQWMTVKLPFAEMIPVFRARRLATAAPLATDQIASLQVMLSKFEHDGDLNPTFRAGAFQLELAWIGAWGAPNLILVGDPDQPLPPPIRQTLADLPSDSELNVRIVTAADLQQIVIG